MTINTTWLCIIIGIFTAKNNCFVVFMSTKELSSIAMGGLCGSEEGMDWNEEVIYMVGKCIIKGE
jgi:hypothetical protein